MNQILSDKIKVMSMICIILVLYIHTGFHDYPHEILGMPFNHYLQNAISGMLGRTAVPIFYMISGYLFFLHIDNIKDVVKKIQKRMRTLVVPFSIAALFFPLFFIIIEQIPSTSKFINSGSMTDGILSKSIGQLFIALFFDAGNGSPIAFQLWFLRDLILVIAITPFLHYMRLFPKMEILGLILLFILSYSKPPYIPISALFWFLLGARFLPLLHQIKALPIIMFYITISTIQVAYPNKLWHLISLPVTMVGVVAIWRLYDVIVGANFCLNKNSWLANICGYSFFIYLFHEPTLNIIRKVLIVIGGHSSASFALTYLLSPWIFAIVWIIVAKGMQKYMPKVYDICTGGR